MMRSEAEKKYRRIIIIFRSNNHRNSAQHRLNHHFNMTQATSFLRLAPRTSTRMGAPRALLRSFATPSSYFASSLLGTANSSRRQKRFFSASDGELTEQVVHFNLPHNPRNKVVSPEDAVSLVNSGDTICSSGFVCQGAPEYILRHLGEQYEKTGEPHSLTLLFGGGPGDYGARGLNHLAKKSDDPNVPPMLRRTIGGHYGQVPKIADLALNNEVEAHILPMGSISRMIRAQSAHSPGHITTVGLGTFLDPETGTGGAINELALESDLHKELITKVEILGSEYLMYKALPIDVAIIRATTGDSKGNLTTEDESLLADQMIMASAARNSNGIVLAQVKQVAMAGSLRTRDVSVPGPMVDCVVAVPNELHVLDHAMSYITTHDPVLTGQIRTPVDDIPKMKLTERKVIARRAAMMLKPGKFVNLGIGLPDGVAAVAGEEDVLDHITLTTEPGVVGGLPATGHEFGPASNPDALIEMNQIFDYYNGSGLDICFLGAAEISSKGDVNVSRLTKDKLTGPGGFIDITNATPIICFMGTFTARGLKINLSGDGTMSIENEGKVSKFVNDVYETTFSAKQAMKNGQRVFYVTERCVFRKTAIQDTLELIEIAPGIDLEKDILSHMEFRPVISPNLKLMDERIFKDEKMNIRDDVFGSLEDRVTYDADTHSLYLDLFGVSLGSLEDIKAFFFSLEKIFCHYAEGGKNKFNAYLQYDGFDCRSGLEDDYAEFALDMESKYFNKVKRYGGMAFRRAKLGAKIKVHQWDPHEVFTALVNSNSDGCVSTQQIRDGIRDLLNIQLSQEEVKKFLDNQGDGLVPEKKFVTTLASILKKRGFYAEDH